MNFLITGGASGLGNPITRAIAGAYPDSMVYFTYCHSEEKAKLLEKEFANSKAIHCDFTNETSLISLCDFIKGSGVSVLINNAITGLQKQYFHKTSPTYFGNSFSYDILPVLKITQAFILRARENKSGKIITILSSALNGTPPIGWSVYLANKSYMLSMHRSWVAENRSFNITSNCVLPDFMITPLHRDLDERIIEEMTKKHPMKKLLTIEDTAKVILSLCDPAYHLNDQEININLSQQNQ